MQGGYHGSGYAGDTDIGRGQELRRQEKEAGECEEEGSTDPARRHGGAADQGATVQHEIEHQPEQEGQGKDGAMNARVAEQEQRKPQTNGTTPAMRMGAPQRNT